MYAEEINFENPRRGRPIPYSELGLEDFENLISEAIS